MNTQINGTLQGGKIRYFFEGYDGRAAKRLLLHNGELSHPSDAETLEWKQDGIEIGRSSENDISLRSPVVSRHHARLLAQAGNIVVIDLGSTNGTFVDGHRLEPGQPEPLHPGSEVSFGHGAALTLAG